MQLQRLKWGLVSLFMLFMLVKVNAITPNVTVAADGSGDYTSVQTAINEAPNDLTEQYVIFIKNGTYDEKIFIEKNFITLIGEDRDSTIIVQAILRRLWLNENPSDWGVATINIQNGVTDLTLANMTILNNFADVYPETPEPNDHTMAIRGGGHRIKIVNCNVVATGGDTLSLWNTDGGMYYHASCYFEGYVDYVCPRGYCYIDGGEFFGHNRSASIWHDGSGGKDHKFVIRNSSFDGVPDFPLGRFHRMAAFYLLDCFFSIEMDDRNIYYTGDSLSQDRDKLIYGKRVYYDNCHKAGGDYEWHADNLETAENSPTPESIDAKWTFNNEWDPVSEIRGLVPVPILPSPFQKQGDVDADATFSWFPVEGADSYSVFLGMDGNLEFLGNTSDTLFDPQGLQNQSIYNWRVDAITGTDTAQGELWEFRTRIVDSPAKASNPSPEDSSTVTESAFYLEWEFVEWITNNFDVYFDTLPNPEFMQETTRNQIMVYSLEDNKTYYWRVDPKNNIGTTTGDIWQFLYRDPAVSVGEVRISDLNGSLINRYFPNPANEEINFELRNPARASLVFSFFRLDGALLFRKTVAVEPGKDQHITFKSTDILGPNHAPEMLICMIQSNEQRQVLKIHFGVG